MDGRLKLWSRLVSFRLTAALVVLFRVWVKLNRETVLDAFSRLLDFVLVGLGEISCDGFEGIEGGEDLGGV